jgi:signal transduction histidine kinase
MGGRPGPGSDPAATRELERGLVRVRWFAVAFGLFQVWQLSSTEPIPPGYVVSISYASIAALGIGNLIISRATRRAADAARLHQIGMMAFALDIAVIFTNIWIGSYDRNAAGWNLAYILPLEGALRYALRGAVVSISLFFLSELAREFYRLSLFDDLTFEISAVTFRVGIFAIIALVAGMMARNLLRQRQEAESHAGIASALADREAVARAELEALHDVVLAGLAGESFDATMSAVVATIAGVFEYESLAIRVVEPDTDPLSVRCVGAHGFPDGTIGQVLPAGKGIVGRALTTGRPELVPDMRKDPDYLEWVPGTLSEMIVPIRIGERLLGLVDVRSSFAGRYDADDLARLERLASQIGLVLSNAQLLAQERQTVERLRQLDSMKSDFVAVTSHELRTPLTSVVGFIKTLRRPDVSLDRADVQEFLAIVDRQTERLTRLVEDLLLTARIESGTIDLQMDSIDIARVLEESLDVFDVAKARVQLAVQPDLPTAVTDGYRLGQIAQNLIENALKFSPEDRPVRVTAVSEGETILIEVADRGSGIPPDELPHVFDRFHQVGDPLDRHVQGLGLGLYIVKNIVDALNGSIDVRSIVGEGSTFTVRLPFVTARSASARGA